MPCFCAVYGCQNYHPKTKEQNILYHRFPSGKDMVSAEIQEEWIIRCMRGNTFNVRNSRVCSVHFTDDDYERDLQHELLGLPLRRMLKKTAVPSLKLFTSEFDQIKLYKRSVDQKQKKKNDKNSNFHNQKVRKSLVDDALANTESNYKANSQSVSQLTKKCYKTFPPSSKALDSS